MKRKRFIKLLMARGRSRNDATQAAQDAVRGGHTYDGAYFAVRVNDGDPEAVEAVQAVCKRIIEAVQAISRAAVETAQKIAEAMPAVVEMAKRAAEQIAAATE